MFHQEAVEWRFMLHCPEEKSHDRTNTSPMRKGRKVAVQIDLTKHRELWQDIHDVLVSRSRRHEKRIPLEKVKEGLVKSGKLSRE